MLKYLVSQQGKSAALNNRNKCCQKKKKKKNQGKEQHVVKRWEGCDLRVVGESFSEEYIGVET